MEYLPLRYPPEAGEVWKLVPAAEQDALVDDFMVEVREVTDPGELALIRAALSPDEVTTLLTYSRRRLINGDAYRSGALDVFALIDPDRADLPRAEIERTAGLALGFTTPAERMRAPAGAEEIAAAVVPPRRSSGFEGPGYRGIETDGQRRLIYDLHAERPSDYRDWIGMVIDLAELTEFKGYRVESITLVDDGPELLAEAAATGDPIGFAFLSAAQCSAVRAGPRPGGRTGRLSAHLIRANTAEDAAEFAAKATAMYSPQGAVLTHVVEHLCLIFISDGTDPLESYGFAIRALLRGPNAAGRRYTWRHVKADPTEPDYHTMLVMDVQYRADLPIHQWWLAGPPAQGSHPDPDGAWQTLVSDGDPFRGFQMTQQEDHGPGWAKVRGFWRGSWVDHDFGRHVTAGAAEWERLRPFLQPDGFPPAGSEPRPEDGDR